MIIIRMEEGLFMSPCCHAFCIKILPFHLSSNLQYWAYPQVWLYIGPNDFGTHAKCFNQQHYHHFVGTLVSRVPRCLIQKPIYLALHCHYVNRYLDCQMANKNFVCSTLTTWCMLEEAQDEALLNASSSLVNVNGIALPLKTPLSLDQYYQLVSTEAGASTTWYQHICKWPVLGSQPPQRIQIAIYGNVDITL